MALKSKDYYEFAFSKKTYEDLIDDVPTDEHRRIKPFQWASNISLTQRPDFAKWTGGTLGGVFVPTFHDTPLDDIFAELFGERFLTKRGCELYESKTDGTGIYIPSNLGLKTLFESIPNTYFAKWNHLWKDIVGAEYRPTDNVDRYEYHEYGKILAADGVTPISSERKNTTTYEGEEKNSHNINTSETPAHHELSSKQLTYGDGTDGDYGHKLETKTEYSKHYTDNLAVKDGPQGSITETDNNDIVTRKYQSPHQTETETKVSGFNSTDYEDKEKVTVKESGNYSDEHSAPAGKHSEVVTEKLDRENNRSYDDTDGSNDKVIVQGGQKESYTYSTSAGGVTANASDNYDKREFSNRKDTEKLEGGELTRIHGNIGVTMTTQLLDAEIEFRKWQFFRMVMDDIAEVLFLKCY